MRAIRKIKTKHYARQILWHLFALGILTITGGGPLLGWRLVQQIFGKQNAPKKKSADVFRYLLRKGFVEWRREGHDVVISLTKEGKKYAGKYQIDELALKRPKAWDGMWRLVVFDIPNASTFVRNVFRRKLKEFGFYALQKSIWVYPFDCREEIVFLREFLGANSRQVQLIEATKVESEDVLLRHFSLGHGKLNV